MRTTLDYPDERALPVVPRREDGDNWSYALAHDENRVTFADTTSELVGIMIEGYDDLGADQHDEALIARYQHLVLLAGHYQALAIERAMTDGLLDNADEDTLTALYADRGLPYSGIPQWNGPRLYLLATDYSPYSDRRRPAGDVVLLDPAKETTYLRALHELGFVGFWTFRGAVDQPSTV